MKTLLILASPLVILLTSCSNIAPVATDPYVAFTQGENYPKSSAVYRNEALYDSAQPGQTSIRIDLSDQRAQLLVGPDKKVAIDTPVCTGKAGKRTPTGTYPIKEKIVKKRSTIFGSLYKNGRKVYGGDHRKYRGSYDKYIGSSLPYWMRMTGDGIGMHGSSAVHRYPGSNGCVRTPHHVVDDIFRKVRRGTPIVVVP